MITPCLVGDEGMVFMQDEYRMSNACVDYAPGSWELFCMGFQEAACALIKAVLNEEEGQDWLVYPILFCYRHYVELRLKYLLLLTDSLPEKLKGSHDLQSLWDLVRKQLPPEERLSEAGCVDLKHVADAIGQLSTIDLKGDSFRYPQHLDGEVVRFGQRNIGLASLKQVIDEVTCVLEALASVAEHHVENRAESRSLQREAKEDVEPE